MNPLISKKKVKGAKRIRRQNPPILERGKAGKAGKAARRKSAKVQTILARHSAHPPFGLEYSRINSYILGYIKTSIVHIQRKLWTGTNRYRVTAVLFFGIPVTR